MLCSMVAKTQYLNYILQSGEIIWPEVSNNLWNRGGDKARFNQNYKLRVTVQYGGKHNSSTNFGRGRLNGQFPKHSVGCVRG